MGHQPRSPTQLWLTAWVNQQVMPQPQGFLGENSLAPIIRHRSEEGVTRTYVVHAHGFSKQINGFKLSGASFLPLEK